MRTTYRATATQIAVADTPTQATPMHAAWSAMNGNARSQSMRSSTRGSCAPASTCVSIQRNQEKPRLGRHDHRRKALPVIACSVDPETSTHGKPDWMQRPGPGRPGAPSDAEDALHFAREPTFEPERCIQRGHADARHARRGHRLVLGLGIQVGCVSGGEMPKRIVVRAAQDLGEFASVMAV